MSKTAKKSTKKYLVLCHARQSNNDSNFHVFIVAAFSQADAEKKGLLLSIDSLCEPSVDNTIFDIFKNAINKITVISTRLLSDIPTSL